MYFYFNVLLTTAVLNFILILSFSLLMLIKPSALMTIFFNLNSPKQQSLATYDYEAFDTVTSNDQ